jgi:hypothetical protein
MAPVRSLTIIRGSFLELSEVALGGLVPDPTNPGVDFCPEQKYSFRPDQLSIRYVENFRQLLSKERHRGISANLTQLFSSKLTTRAESTVGVIAPRSTIYYLKHPSSHFLQMCKDRAVREWIEGIVKHCSIYLIVGFVTVTQAEVEYGRSRFNETENTANVPLSTIITTGVSSVLPASANIFDSGGELKSTSSFVAPGERVIGIQYKRVRFHRFSKVDIDEAVLKDNQWHMFLNARNRGDDDIAEADLCDSMEVKDLELSEEEFTVNVEDEEFVFIDE